jgi:hypothetical protein
MIKQPKTKREAVDKLLKELESFGVELDINYKSCEIYGLRSKMVGSFGSRRAKVLFNPD